MTGGRGPREALSPGMAGVGSVGSAAVCAAGAAGTTTAGAATAAAGASLRSSETAVDWPRSGAWQSSHSAALSLFPSPQAGHRIRRHCRTGAGGGRTGD